MVQYVFKNKVYIIGKPDEILTQLKILQSSFTTLKEFLESKASDIEA